MDPIEVTENIIYSFPFLKSFNLDEDTRKTCDVVVCHYILEKLAASLEVCYIHEIYIYKIKTEGNQNCMPCQSMLLEKCM